MKFIGFYDYTVILTYTSLVSAIVGIVQVFHGKSSIAVLCLMISGICDAFDGKVARSKKNRTDDEKAFGIQIDSLCDAVSFGVFPAILCYSLGLNGIIGIIIVASFALCAVIRLAFFNVIEAKRQKTESGGNKIYRGLPVTSISMILPLFYLLGMFMNEFAFIILLHFIIGLTAFLFVLDFKFKKPQLFR